ncbi:ribosome small subunit-dependent GTPase A [Rapidithrix thailandica]|uniref:Small ribosomal subunit biogenesis GTPase RsgA n=1 Tax=Rapidithrix thailandica TaxID=413964 RepID=A0AAW9SJ53_9BACT
MKKGFVIKSTGSWYEIRDDEGKAYKGRLRGKFKQKGYKVTNPIAVGDYVKFELEQSQEGTVLITDILPRDNHIIRQSTHRKWHGHIIAANMDQAIILVTLSLPRTSLGFLDRFLVAAEAYDIPAVIVFNKIDLLDEKAEQEMGYLMDLYNSIGYKCLSLCALTGKNVEAFIKVIQHKKTLIAGHSGVGKSTLINRVNPEIQQKTAEISTFANKGKHTTTYAEMFEILPGTFLIDTPGIKELGIMHVEENELGFCFPEIREIQQNCKFYNCTHTHEPGCAVLEKVENEEIAYSRYLSYLSILENEDNRR